MSHTKIIATYMTKPFSIVVALLAQTKGIGFSGKLISKYDPSVLSALKDIDVDVTITSVVAD
jgi:hypothetical protein